MSILVRLPVNHDGSTYHPGSAEGEVLRTPIMLGQVTVSLPLPGSPGLLLPAFLPRRVFENTRCRNEKKRVR